MAKGAKISNTKNISFKCKSIMIDNVTDKKRATPKSY